MFSSGAILFTYVQKNRALDLFGLTAEGQNHLVHVSLIKPNIYTEFHSQRNSLFKLK